MTRIRRAFAICIHQPMHSAWAVSIVCHSKQSQGLFSNKLVPRDEVCPVNIPSRWFLSHSHSNKSPLLLPLFHPSQVTFDIYCNPRYSWAITVFVHLAPLTVYCCFSPLIPFSLVMALQVSLRGAIWLPFPILWIYEISLVFTRDNCLINYPCFPIDLTTEISEQKSCLLNWSNNRDSGTKVMQCNMSHNFAIISTDYNDRVLILSTRVEGRGNKEVAGYMVA